MRRATRCTVSLSTRPFQTSGKNLPENWADITFVAVLLGLSIGAQGAFDQLDGLEVNLRERMQGTQSSCRCSIPTPAAQADSQWVSGKCRLQHNFSVKGGAPWCQELVCGCLCMGVGMEWQDFFGPETEVISGFGQTVTVAFKMAANPGSSGLRFFIFFQFQFHANPVRWETMPLIFQWCLVFVFPRLVVRCDRLECFSFADFNRIPHVQVSQ